jgi:hypothetical protein
MVGEQDEVTLVSQVWGTCNDARTAMFLSCSSDMIISKAFALRTVD